LIGLEGSVREIAGQRLAVAEQIRIERELEQQKAREEQERKLRAKKAEQLKKSAAASNISCT